MKHLDQLLKQGWRLELEYDPVDEYKIRMIDNNGVPNGMYFAFASLDELTPDLLCQFDEGIEVFTIKL